VSAVIRDRCRVDFLDWLDSIIASKYQIRQCDIEDRRFNSYERSLLTEHLSNEVLISFTKAALNNCARPHGIVPSTYDEAVINAYVPELLRRLEEAESNKA
jgi:hypothetical protein